MKRDMSDVSRRRFARRLSIGIPLVFVLASITCCVMPHIEIGNPDLSMVRDGTWVGYYDATLVKAKVAVVMEAHRIISITILEHDCSSIGKKAEGIVDAVLAQQSLAVDVISGATDSSLCILKATELALCSGME